MSYPVNSADNDFSIPASNQFDVKKFVFKIIGLLPWFILSVAISYFTAQLYLRYTMKVYHIAAYLLIKDMNEGGSSDYKALKEMGLVNGNKDVQNEIDILKSFSLMTRVVDSLNLHIEIYKEGRVTLSPLFGEDMPVTIDPIEEYETGRPEQFRIILNPNNFSLGKSATKPGKLVRYGEPFEVGMGKYVITRNPNIKAETTGYRLKFESKIDKAKEYRGLVDVRQTHDMGGILEIAMNDEIPERAVMVLNKLIQVYNDAGLDDKNLAARLTIKFLNERIDTVARELNYIELSAERFRRNNKITSPAEEGTAFLGQAVLVDNQKTEQQAKLKLLETLERYVADFNGTSEMIPSSLGLEEPILLTLIATNNELIQKKQAAAIVSTENDPTIIQYTAEIKNVRENLLRNLRLLKTGFQTNLSQINANYGSLEGKISTLPGKERQLINIRRQMNLKETLYLYLLQKREETELSLAANINNTRLVDSAFNTGAIKPVSAQVQLVALLLGLAIPALIIMLKEFFNTRLNDKEELENGTSVPILGELSYEKKTKNIVIDNKSRSAISEQFRLIRTNIQYMGADKPVKTLMVSSFMSGEGKSFVSLNLASSLGITGAKTVILEFDLRKPKLSKYLNVQSEYGITNYIIKDIPIEDIIQKVPGFEHISMISSGPIPPNPAELILSKKTEILFEYLRQNFDIIIIDTAPVGLVTDALLLERYVDLSIFIVRHKYSYKAVVPYIEKLNKDKKFKNLALIVNGIKKDSSFGYGYGNGYGYGYGYGYYVTDKKKGFLSHFFGGLGIKD